MFTSDRLLWTDKHCLLPTPMKHVFTVYVTNYVKCLSNSVNFLHPWLIKKVTCCWFDIERTFVILCLFHNFSLMSWCITPYRRYFSHWKRTMGMWTIWQLQTIGQHIVAFSMSDVNICLSYFLNLSIRARKDPSNVFT